MAKAKLVAVLVTTEFKGVFFGYAPPGEEGPARCGPNIRHCRKTHGTYRFTVPWSSHDNHG